MTVSNVVNGRYGEVSNATRVKVEQAVKTLAYRPHAGARGLRISRNYLVGMVIVDPSPAFLTKSFTTWLVAGLTNHLNESGYRLALQGIRPHQLQDAQALQVKDVDALCVLLSGSPSQRRDYRAVLESLEIPVVLFQDFDVNGADDHCVICQEDFRGGYEIARHVLDRGARQLAMLGTVHEWPAFAERARGMRQAVSEVEGATLNDILCSSAALDDIELAIRRYLETSSMPEAMLGASDNLGIGAMLYLERQALRIPEDVMITGFNGLGPQSHAPVSLTTVRSAAYEMGMRAGVEILIRLETGRFRQARILLPVEVSLAQSA